MHWHNGEVEDAYQRPQLPPSFHQRECVLDHESAPSIEQRSSIGTYPADGSLNCSRVFAIDGRKESYETSHIHDGAERLIQREFLRCIAHIESLSSICRGLISWKRVFQILLPQTIRRTGNQCEYDELAKSDEIEREFLLFRPDQRRSWSLDRLTHLVLICLDPLRQNIGK